jgi:hypothetical protein
VQHVALARLADLDATIIASATRLGPADKAAIAELVLQEVLDRVGCRLVVVALLLLEARCAALRLQAAFCCWQALGQVTQCMRDSHELIDQPSADPRPRWLTPQLPAGLQVGDPGLAARHGSGALQQEVVPAEKLAAELVGRLAGGGEGQQGRQGQPDQAGAGQASVAAKAGEGEGEEAALSRQSSGSSLASFKSADEGEMQGQGQGQGSAAQAGSGAAISCPAVAAAAADVAGLLSRNMDALLSQQQQGQQGQQEGCEQQQALDLSQVFGGSAKAGSAEEEEEFESGDAELWQTVRAINLAASKAFPLLEPLDPALKAACQLAASPGRGTAG